ncbi:MAG TPA: hypothetical protein PKJ74_07245 [Chitinophagales bacterium]|nr:hypothetical protein [Chitinophagales bacterium]
MSDLEYQEADLSRAPKTESVNPVKIVKVLDARIDGMVQREYVCQKSGNSINIIKYASTSNSSSQLLFNVNTPGSHVFIDRRAYIEYQTTFVFSGNYDATPGPEPANAVSRFTPRPYDPVAQIEGLRNTPLNSAASSITLNLDGVSLTTNRDDTAAALSWYRSHPEDDWHQNSMHPSMPDEWQNYQTSPVTYGSRNPFAIYNNEIDHHPDTGYRSLVGYNLIMTAVDYVSVPNKWSQTVTVKWTEPIMLSPLMQNNCQWGLGIYGCRQLQLLLTFSFGLYPRLWSGLCQLSNTPTYGPRPNITIASQSANDAQLLLMMVTPNNTQTIPNSLSWKQFQELRQTNAAGGDVLGGNSSSITSSSIALQSIPYQVLVFMKQQYSDMGSVGYCDSFARIDKVSLLWNNVSGLLSSDNSVTLYNRSRANGYMGTWKQWNCVKDTPLANAVVGDTTVVNIPYTFARDYGSGSVLCLRFDRDISLPSELSSGVGSSGTYQFQITVDYTNPSTVTKRYTLYCVFMLEGSLSWKGNSSGGGLFVSEIGLLNEMDVINAPLLEGASDPHTNYYGSGSRHYGGSFWSKLSKFAKGAWNHAIKPAVKALAPLAAKAVSAYQPELAPVANTIANAVQGLGRPVRAGRSSGGRASGGRALSRARLR